MSQDETNQEFSRREEAALEVALSALEGEGTAPHAGPVDLETEALGREYLEVLGLLAYGLEPETPRPELRRRILAGLEGTPEPVAELRPPAEPAPAAMFPQPSAAPRWGALLAASLALVVLGLGWLSLRQQALVDKLDQIASLDGANNPLVQENARLRAELANAENRLDMVTVVAQSLYPLRPPGVDPRRPTPAAHQPSGVMYVCPNHQQWYLSVRGLDPPPADSHYELWFVTRSGPVSNGPMEVRRYGTTELRAPTMPDGTTSMMITLEPTPDSGRPTASPAGPVVLEAGDAVTLTL